jgi:c-di-GMP-binding flagellar brake protein YcgR
MFKRSKAEKGKESPGKPEPSVPFQFSLMLPDRRLFPNDIVDISMGGAAMVFKADECPDFPRNENVKLILIMTHTRKTVEIEATVTDSRTSKGTKLYHFQFVDPQILDQELDPSLLDYFNRRNAFRVNCVVTPPLEVTLKRDGVLDQGWIIDISKTGMGFGVKPKVAEKLGSPVRLTLTFKLPGAQMPVKLEGKVAHRTPHTKVVRYGIEFNWKETEGSQQHETAINSYILRRQQELVRIR